MILASIRSKVPGLELDGQLVIIHPNRLTVAILPDVQFSSLRQALESWGSSSAKLQNIDAQLRAGYWSHTVSTEQVVFCAPLPRSWTLLDGSAYVQHIKLVRKARNAELPEDLLTIPLMYQGASEGLLSPFDDIPLLDPAYGVDFESEVAIITDAVPQGTTAPEALQHIKLIMLMNDISLRELIPRELSTGFGFFHGKPPSSFSPFVVTPEELKDTWRGGKVHLPLETYLNNELFGSPNAGEMHFSFLQLIEHATKTRALGAGTIIGSGTVSNTDASLGSSCIVERRMLEKINSGAITTPYLKDGDRIKISMSLRETNIFGSIDQVVRQIKR